MKRRLIIAAVMAVMFGLAAPANTRAESGFTAGPWGYLQEWQGCAVDIQFESNIIMLKNVRLAAVTEHGLVVKEGNSRVFVPYHAIVAVGLVK